MTCAVGGPILVASSADGPQRRIPGTVPGMFPSRVRPLAPQRWRHTQHGFTVTHTPGDTDNAVSPECCASGLGLEKQEVPGAGRSVEMAGEEDLEADSQGWACGSLAQMLPSVCPLYLLSGTECSGLTPKPPTSGSSSHLKYLQVVLCLLQQALQGKVHPLLVSKRSKCWHTLRAAGTTLTSTCSSTWLPD